MLTVLHFRKLQVLSWHFRPDDDHLRAKNDGDELHFYPIHAYAKIRFFDSFIIIYKYEYQQYGLKSLG